MMKHNVLQPGYRSDRERRFFNRPVSNSGRTFSRVFALCAIVFFATCSPATAQNRGDRPNVLFLIVDDVNDWIGALQTHPQVQTPHIDRLIRRGTLFANAHAQAPIDNPSRTSVFTGLRPSSTGVYGLSPQHWQVEALADVTTLPQYFEQRGYHTLAAGKIFGSSPPAEARENEFREWGPDPNYGPLPEEKIVREPLDMVNHPLIDWGPHPDADSLLSDYRVAAWAVNRLERFAADESEQPFFLAAGFMQAHVPFFVPEEWFELYPEEQVVLPPAPATDRMDLPDFAWYTHWYLPEPRLSWLLDHDQWRAKVRAYLAAISFVDAQIGKVLDALREEGLEEETIVVLWSDHGYHLGEKGITGKNSLWERSTHVPLVFAGPGVPAGIRTDRPVELLDIYPTLLDLAELPFNEQAEGLSLVPELADGDSPRRRPALTTHNPANHAVRTERWRYIRYADGSEELYDHYRDPYEWSNLAGDPEYRNLMDELSEWFPSSETPHAPGSGGRVLIREDGVWYWEGEPISFDELID